MLTPSLRKLKKKKKLKDFVFKMTLKKPNVMSQTRAIARMIDRIAAKAKIGRKVSPHMLRHSYATMHYKLNNNILQL